jgi:hypothetical protein
VDATGGIDFGDRGLHAQVVGHAQQGRRAGQRQNVSDDDLGVGDTLLGGGGGAGAGGQQRERCELGQAVFHVVSLWLSGGAVVKIRDQ